MDDVLQDAYLRASQRLDEFRGDARFSAWLYRIVFNACMDVLRRRRSHDERDESHTMTVDDGPDHAELTVTARRENGEQVSFQVEARVDSEVELAYYRHGGVLQMVLRRMLASSR